jgi:hypothetical protein
MGNGPGSGLSNDARRVSSTTNGLLPTTYLCKGAKRLLHSIPLHIMPV